MKFTRNTGYTEQQKETASSSQTNIQSYLMQAQFPLGSCLLHANVSILVCITDYSEPEVHAGDNLNEIIFKNLQKCS